MVERHFVGSSYATQGEVLVARVTFWNGQWLAYGFALGGLGIGGKNAYL